MYNVKYILNKLHLRLDIILYNCYSFFLANCYRLFDRRDML